MRASVLGLLSRVLPPAKIRELDKAGEYPFEAHKALAEAATWGSCIRSSTAAWPAATWTWPCWARRWATITAGSPRPTASPSIYAGMHIALHGSPDMKREVLPKIISGDMRLALCLSEPDHGSDVAGIELAAVREGNGYVLNGQKIYNSAAHVAHNLVVVAKTKPGRGYDGISMFLVDTSLPGVSIRRLSALGRHTTEANHCFFENVRTSGRPHHRRGEQRLARPDEVPQRRAAEPRRQRCRQYASHPRSRARLCQVARAVRPAHQQVPGRIAQARRDGDDVADGAGANLSGRADARCRARPGLRECRRQGLRDRGELEGCRHGHADHGGRRLHHGPGHADDVSRCARRHDRRRAPARSSATSSLAAWACRP